MDNMFSYTVAIGIMNDDYKPQSIIEYKERDDQSKWKEVIQVELNSLNK